MTDLNRVNFMSKERFNNLSVTNDDELYIVETVVPDDEDVVHKTGDETIYGNKIFNDNVSVSNVATFNGTSTFNGAISASNTLSVTGATTINNTLSVSGVSTFTASPVTTSSNGYKVNCPNIDLSATPAENIYDNAVIVNDKNGNYIGYYGPGYYSNGSYTMRMGIKSKNTTTYNTIAIGYDSNGNGYTFVMTPDASNSTSNDNIASCGWVNDPSKSTNVVHRSGDETIAGTKTFNKTAGSSNIVIKSSLAEKTTVPSSNDFSLVQYTDKNNLEIGVVYLRNTPTAREMCLKVHAFDGTSQEMIKIGYDTNNNVYTSAPTPTSATDNTTKLATTAHLINVLKAIYPVGSLYMGTQASCPMSSFFGTWELVSSGKALWTGNGTSGSGTTANTNYANAPANTTINAGLPDPDVDVIYRQDSTSSGVYQDKFGTDGWTGSAYSNTGGTDEWMQSSKDKGSQRPLAAIFTNSIYGASSTVQPPAYVVNVWRRTA